jgi:hypothetical protein
MSFQDKIRQLVEDKNKENQAAEEEKRQAQENAKRASATFAKSTNDTLLNLVIPAFYDAVTGLRAAGVRASAREEKDSRTGELRGVRLSIEDGDQGNCMPFLRYSGDVTHGVVLVETGSVRPNTLEDPYRGASDANSWSAITRDRIEMDVQALVTEYLKRRTQ